MLQKAGVNDAQLIADDHHESLGTDKNRLIESITEVEASHPKEVGSSALSLRPSEPETTPETARPAVPGSESGLSSGISRLRLWTEGLGSIFVEKGPEVETGSFLEQIITVPLPPVDTHPSSPTESLEDLPALPSSEPSSRPGTPETAAGSGEFSSPKFPEDRLNTKAKAEYLRLPSGISQTPSSDQDLLPLSPDLSADSKYASDTSLQREHNTPSISPEFQNLEYLASASVSHPIDDPEYEDPSLSFGSGIIQTVPVAQVGLRSPIFPGASGFGLFPSAVDSTTRRFFPQQGGSDIDDEPDYDSAAREKDNQGQPTPSIEIDELVEGSDERNQGGEEEEGWNSLS